MLVVMLASAGCGGVPAEGTAADVVTSPEPTAPPACRGGRSEGSARSIAADHGGAPTPVDAAVSFVREGSQWTQPLDGWVLTSSPGGSATVSAHDAQLHVVQLPDATWVVDSGTRCS